MLLTQDLKFYDRVVTLTHSDPSTFNSQADTRRKRDKQLDRRAAEDSQSHSEAQTVGQTDSY